MKSPKSPSFISLNVCEEGTEAWEGGKEMKRRMRKKMGIVDEKRKEAICGR